MSLDKIHIQRVSPAWLTEFRWAMLVAQVLSVLCVSLLNLTPALNNSAWIFFSFLICWTVGSNLILPRILAKTQREGLISLLVLSLDTIMLTALFFFSGKAANPFTIFYLAEITLGVTVLGFKRALPVLILSVIGFSSLFLIEDPHMHHHMHLSLDNHLLGMLIAFVFTSVLITFFLQRISKEIDRSLRNREKLRKAEENQSRLASLTALTAQTAHELATPLSTVAISAGELLHSAKKERLGKRFESEAKLIQEEVSRLRQLLDRMVLRGGSLQGTLPSQLTVTELVDFFRIALQHDTSLSPTITVTGRNSIVSLPIESVVNALVSLVSNSEQAGATEVEIEFSSTAKKLQVIVEDNGSGMAEDLLSKVGEPFISTRTPGDGMGLGLFVVKLLFEGLGGMFSITSQEGRGTTVSLSIPIKDIQVNNERFVKAA